MADSCFKIVVKLELYEAKDKMQEKKYVKKYWATTGNALHLTKSIQGFSQIVVADSWSGSVKSVLALSNIGLYSKCLWKLLTIIF